MVTKEVKTKNIYPHQGITECNSTITKPFHSQHTILRS